MRWDGSLISGPANTSYGMGVGKGQRMEYSHRRQGRSKPMSLEIW
jgi:hypothetical protein